uniref:DUF4604 domain-containing protein n=1 Tax=Elaeophora elaphi TaxID=1147741 RepID=A0A0R3RWJ5_9BILA
MLLSPRAGQMGWNEMKFQDLNRIIAFIVDRLSSMALINYEIYLSDSLSIHLCSSLRESTLLSLLHKERTKRKDMGDDYEILDPTKSEAKFADDAPPSTPIVSSIKQPVSDASRVAGDTKLGSENIRQKGRAVLGKKDAEVKSKRGKRGAKIDEKERRQKDDDDRFEDVYGNF